MVFEGFEREHHNFRGLNPEKKVKMGASAFATSGKANRPFDLKKLPLFCKLVFLLPVMAPEGTPFWCDTFSKILWGCCSKGGDRGRLVMVLPKVILS